MAFILFILWFWQSWSDTERILHLCIFDTQGLEFTRQLTQHDVSRNVELNAHPQYVRSANAGCIGLVSLQGRCRQAGSKEGLQGSRFKPREIRNEEAQMTLRTAISIKQTYHKLHNFFLALSFNSYPRENFAKALWSAQRPGGIKPGRYPAISTGSRIYMPGHIWNYSLQIKIKVIRYPHCQIWVFISLIPTDLENFRHIIPKITPILYFLLPLLENPSVITRNCFASSQ